MGFSVNRNNNNYFTFCVLPVYLQWQKCNDNFRTVIAVSKLKLRARPTSKI